MDAWQSPVRPNLRTGLITDPANGVLGGGAAPLIDGGGPGRRPRLRFGSYRRAAPGRALHGHGPEHAALKYTVSKPKTWTRPWSVEAPLLKIDPPLYEFACHEQNYGVINVVMGAQIRATEGALGPRDPRVALPTERR
jgi:hypothetical protein